MAKAATHPAATTMNDDPGAIVASERLAQWRGVNILYEDNHILGCVKPAGTLTQAADPESADDMVNRLKEFLCETHGKPGRAFLGLVHRLDRPVGGAMVFAKTSKAASRLSEQIRERIVEKRYLAVVVGHFPAAERRLVHLLAKDPRTNRVAVVEQGHPKGRRAELAARLLDFDGRHSLLEIDLRTGRPHQIRVQLSTEGFPVVGDRKYGKPSGCEVRNPALWSWQLRFSHPTRRIPVLVAASPPEEAPWSAFATMATFMKA